jgi:hypothetical protein
LLGRGRGAPDGASLHFLHIGKCAGTRIGEIAALLNAAGTGRPIVVHHHDVSLRDLPPGAPYFFSIRDPISRFYSGFYSRRREGRPRLYHPWTEHDRRAFADFEHANDLAESLFAAGAAGDRAFAAMKSIRHAAQDQSDWFCCLGNFLSARPPVWIIRQEQFAGDLDVFLRRAGFALPAELAGGQAGMPRAHSSDYAGLPPLSDRAQDNLRRWYAQDYAFYRACEAWMADEAAGAPEAY